MLNLSSHSYLQRDGLPEHCSVCPCSTHLPLIDADSYSAAYSTDYINVGHITSMNPRGFSLPVEVYLKIVKELTLSDLRSFVRTCVRLHDIGSTILYHTIHLHEDNARAVMQGLLTRLRPASASHRRHPPILNVRVIFYDTDSHDEDLRLLPHLCDVLQNAQNLRYLHIDTCDDSEPILLSIFRRRGLFRTPDSIGSTVFKIEDGNVATTPLYLPHLSTLRTSSTLFLDQFYKCRTLRALIVDAVVYRRELIDMLGHLEDQARRSRLEAFTFSVRSDDFKGAIIALPVILPGLRYLGIVLYATSQLDHATTGQFVQVSPCRP